GSVNTCGVAGERGCDAAHERLAGHYASRVRLDGKTDVAARSRAGGAGRGGRSMQVRVAVVGASGYAGGELLRLISVHPGLELAGAAADSSAGRTAGGLHGNPARPPAL